MTTFRKGNPDLAKQRANSRRPIEGWEVEHLERLGKQLETYRLQAGLSVDQLARAAEMHPRHFRHLRDGVRRTRSSTLYRIALALASHLDIDPDDLHLALRKLAGPALADESSHADRIARRRAKRVAKDQRQRARKERERQFATVVRLSVRQLETGLGGERFREQFRRFVGSG